MASIINASPSNGIVQTADGSGILKIQSNSVTTNALAWVNFVGSSGSRNSSYNVSSVTRSSAGSYVLNFTNTLSDTNYCSVGACLPTSGGSAHYLFYVENKDNQIKTTSQLSIYFLNPTNQLAQDPLQGMVAIFGN